MMKFAFSFYFLKPTASVNATEHVFMPTFTFCDQLTDLKSEKLYQSTWLPIINPQWKDQFLFWFL